ncbi:hypothetical protein K239x_23840 [Planctomycetes bacterium K23_9]|uniref:Uncharacterized protein n=1 Tax=Stieleria marina TaxID=1930275 RepID=A0A517NTH9_9BACT|nr:hypothetical protein K239x_23840 [Planctomycetes bacterium K23_9]
MRCGQTQTAETMRRISHGLAGYQATPIRSDGGSREASPVAAGVQILLRHFFGIRPKAKQHFRSFA